MHTSGPEYTTEGTKWSSPPFKLSVVYHHILSPYSATILCQLYHITTTSFNTPVRQPPPNGSPGEEVRTIVKSTVTQYTVGVSAKRSNHTVDLVNMGGGDRYL